MYLPTSPIIDLYPRHFNLDRNGKRARWEAVVQLPFVDQVRLLDVMTYEIDYFLIFFRKEGLNYIYASFSFAPAREDELTEEERSRSLGIPLRFSFSANGKAMFPFPKLGVLPSVDPCFCDMFVFDVQEF